MRRGITLYEVVVALVIFAAAMAAISEAISTGMRAAVQSRLQSQAILLCQSKMGEVLAGAVPRQSTGDSAFTDPGLDGWKWGLSVKPGPHTGLLDVEVDVNYRLAGNSVDASFALERLVRDPSAFANSNTEAIANAAATALRNAQQLQQQNQQSGTN
jgi:general secretion pathway protein I